jgi:hypothetical protein
MIFSLSQETVGTRRIEGRTLEPTKHVVRPDENSAAVGISAVTLQQRRRVIAFFLLSVVEVGRLPFGTLGEFRYERVTS